MSQAAAAPSEADNNRRLLAIFLIVLIDVLGMTIILPLLPFYSEHFGASPFTVGLLVSSYAVCQLISGPILGHWSDKIGRKPILVVSQIGTLIGFLILAFGSSLFWIFIARIIDGLTAGNLSTAQAYITDVSNPQSRAKALGKIGMAFGIGFFIGPALSAFLFKYGYQAPILAAAALSFMSIVASMTLLPSKQKSQHQPPVNKVPFSLQKFTNYFRQPALASLLLQIFLFYISFTAYMSGFALFAERRFTINGQALNPKQIGYAFTYFGFLGIIIQGFLIGRLVPKWGEKKLALIGFACNFLGYALLSYIDGPLWIGITGLLTSFGSGVLRPVLTSEISRCVGPHERGTIMGVNQSLQSFAQIIAPLLGTFMIGRSWLTEWPWLPSVVSLLGVILIIFQAQNRKKNEAAA